MTATNVPANSGSGDVAVHADVSGLNSGSTYHTRIVAANRPSPAAPPPEPTRASTPSARGSPPRAPTTSPTPPPTLHASVNPKGQTTTYQFQYVTDADYGATGFTGAQVAPADPSTSATAASPSRSPSTSPASTPPPNTTSASSPPSSDGANTGPEATFTTYAAPPDLRR